MGPDRHQPIIRMQIICLTLGCEGSIKLDITSLTKDLSHGEVLKGTTDFRTYESEYCEGINLEGEGFILATYQDEFKELTKLATLLENKIKLGAETAQTL